MSMLNDAQTWMLAATAAGAFAAYARRRAAGAVVGWALKRIVWRQALLPGRGRSTGSGARGCVFCGHDRARRFCARCGRSTRLKPLDVPAALGGADAISPALSPGLRWIEARAAAAAARATSA